MAISTVDIVNLALGHLGIDPIAALTENSQKAQRAATLYEPTRDSVLRAYAWGFANKITTLAQLSGETVPGWDYLYIYPTDCLRVRRLFEDITVPVPPPASFEEVLSPTTSQRCIATSIVPAYVRYTAKVADPNFYDPAFIDALALSLAARLSKHLTDDRALGLQLQNFYLSQISEAKRLDSLEHKVDESTESTFLQARG